MQTTRFLLPLATRWGKSTVQFNVHLAVGFNLLHRYASFSRYRKQRSNYDNRNHKGSAYLLL